MTYFVKKNNSNKKKRILWLHGWGQEHQSFAKLEPFFKDVENVLFDFPGFGKSPPPSKVWGTEKYAEFIENCLQKEPKKETYVLGHSFGCRVALRFAHKYPLKVKGLILISAAGLKRKRSLFFKLKAFFLKSLGRVACLLDRVFKTKLKQLYSMKFGSPDYRNANGIMKEIFVRTISEDLSEIAQKIKTPTLLIYGTEDKETPPEFGKCYSDLLINSKYIEIPNFDHYNILSTGKHQLQNIIVNFMKLEG